MDNKIEWRHMTWQEVRDARDENPTILVPTGTTETQGPNTFVGYESVLPEHLAREVARRTNALVVPTVPYGFSPDFRDYPGTITLRPKVVGMVYEDVIRSVLRHGFDHILFLSMHIPNLPMLEEVAYKIREELGVMVAWINPGKLASYYLREVSPNYDAASAHGADPALSLGLYLAPEAHDAESIEPNEYQEDFQGVDFAGGSTLTFKDFPFNMPLKLGDLSPETGGFGDPQFASRDQGEQIFSKMVDHMVALVERFSQLETDLNSRSD